jgi:hypothetical protein
MSSSPGLFHTINSVGTGLRINPDATRLPVVLKVSHSATDTLCFKGANRAAAAACGAD